MTSTAHQVDTPAAPTRRLPAPRPGLGRRDRARRGHGGAELPGLRHRRARSGRRPRPRAVAGLARSCPGRGARSRRRSWPRARTTRSRGSSPSPTGRSTCSPIRRGTPDRSTRSVGSATPGWGARWRTSCWAARRGDCAPTVDPPAGRARRAADRPRRADGRRAAHRPAVRGDRPAAHQPRARTRPHRFPAAALAALGDPEPPEGLSLHWIADPRPRAELGGLLVDAAEALVADEQQSLDNFAWFRPDNDAEQRHRDGLVLDGQGFSPVQLAVAKLLPPSSRTAGRPLLGERDPRRAHRDRRRVRRRSRRPPRTTGASQLDAGRLLQRIHLRATAAGIALHHMNQITERIDREAAAGAAATFAPRFAALLPAGARPLLAFRVGHPVRDGRPTPRRSLAMVTR